MISKIPVYITGIPGCMWTVLQVTYLDGITIAGAHFVQTVYSVDVEVTTIAG